MEEETRRQKGNQDYLVGTVAGTIMTGVQSSGFGARWLVQLLGVDWSPDAGSCAAVLMSGAVWLAAA